MCNVYNQSNRDRPVNANLTALKYLKLASVSKLVAALSTCRIQVVRTRVRNLHRHYRGLVHVVQELWVCEGFLGLCRGTVPNLLRVVPVRAIIFAIYEYMFYPLHSRASI